MRRAPVSEVGIIRRVPHLRDEAICVRHWDYSETSQTVSLLCREHGLLRGLAKGAKRVGGRFSGGIDLFSHGQVIAIVKRERELSTLTEWTLLRSWRSLRNEIKANQSAYYMVDLVQRLLAPGDPHSNIFEALRSALDAIDRGEVAMSTLRFQWAMLDATGYRPRLEVPAGSGTTLGFAPESGGVVDALTPGSWKVRRQTVELLSRVADGTTGNGIDTDETTSRANRLLATYLRHVLTTQPETMRQLFPKL